jgi:hypothetical protein
VQPLLPKIYGTIGFVSAYQASFSFLRRLVLPSSRSFPFGPLAVHRDETAFGARDERRTDVLVARTVVGLFFPLRDDIAGDLPSLFECGTDVDLPADMGLSGMGKANFLPSFKMITTLESAGYSFHCHKSPPVCLASSIT